MSSLAPLLQGYFVERLQQQRRASPHTVAAYRDTFLLLFAFVEERTGKSPSSLEVGDLNGALVSSFLDHLERDRHNSIRTRNLRLSAIHSLFAYAALRHPEQAADIQRVLAIPSKRFERVDVSFLVRAEIEALLESPDRSSWLGRRDHAVLIVMVETGLRVSELVGLRCSDVVLGTGAHVRCTGKGRRQRATPLTHGSAAMLRDWLAERGGDPDDPLFPSRQGNGLSRHGVAALVAKQVQVAALACPSLANKRVSPHTLRHTCAMRLLEAGLDIATIALWLGHESITSTQVYLHADLTLKERALARTTPLGIAPGRYRPKDPVVTFLEAL